MRYEDFNGIVPSFKKMSSSVVDCIVCWFVNVLLKIKKRVKGHFVLCTGLISVPVNFNVYGYKSKYTKAMIAKVC